MNDNEAFAESLGRLRDEMVKRIDAAERHLNAENFRHYTRMIAALGKMKRAVEEWTCILDG